MRGRVSTLGTYESTLSSYLTMNARRRPRKNAHLLHVGDAAAIQKRLAQLIERNRPRIGSGCLLAQQNTAVEAARGGT